LPTRSCQAEITAKRGVRTQRLQANISEARLGQECPAQGVSGWSVSQQGWE
jgi:hypothetical protein